MLAEYACQKENFHMILLRLLVRRHLVYHKSSDFPDCSSQEPFASFASGSFSFRQRLGQNVKLSKTKGDLLPTLLLLYLQSILLTRIQFRYRLRQRSRCYDLTRGSQFSPSSREVSLVVVRLSLRLSWLASKSLPPLPHGTIPAREPIHNASVWFYSKRFDV